MGKILTDEILEAASELNKCIIANEHSLSVLVGITHRDSAELFQFSVMCSKEGEPFYYYESEDEQAVVDQITAFQSGLWAREVA